MRVLKWVFAALLLTGLTTMWLNRSVVVDAYTTDREPLDFSLDGLDLEIEPEARTTSPFAIPPAPDTRLSSLDLSAAASTPTAQRVVLVGGSSSITGTVVGPDGLVPAAVVLIERHTLDGSATAEVITDESGSWRIAGIRGGRYRIRSFLPGLLATETIEVFFLDDGSSAEVSLRVLAPRDGPVVSFTAPSNLEVGTEQVVAVSVGYDAIDQDGRRILAPSPGLGVEATITGSVDLLSAGQVTTDAYGAARFGVRCQQAGSNILTVRINGQAFGFALPPCTVTPLEVSPVTPEGSDPAGTGSDGEGTDG